jgi:hypothetical protein
MPTPRLLAAVIAATACLAAPSAFAEDDESAPPPLPSSSAPVVVQTPAAVPRSQPAVVQAPPPDASPKPVTGVVQTEHIDTVVVAESGSNVTVHGGGADKYAPDPARKGALIATPIGWGIGTLVLGVGYLSEKGSSSCTYSGSGGYTCAQRDGMPWLVSYDLSMTITPSIPRWAVGDTTGALVFSALRGASVLAASAIDWNKSAFGPTVLGFLVPVTLGVFDIALTPHREDLQPARDTHATARGPSIVAFDASPVSGADHRVNGGMLRLGAIF